MEVNSRGPVFDARGPQIMRNFALDAGETVAHEGVGEVRTQLDRVLQHPTGRYRRSINVVRYGGYHVVNDGKMIYGPWLAGEGSRNKTTRFKGYAHWRRATQVLQRGVGTIAKRLLPGVVGRLNG